MVQARVPEAVPLPPQSAFHVTRVTLSVAVPWRGTALADVTQRPVASGTWIANCGSSVCAEFPGRSADRPLGRISGTIGVATMLLVWLVWVVDAVTVVVTGVVPAATVAVFSILEPLSFVVATAV